MSVCSLYVRLPWDRLSGRSWDIDTQRRQELARLDLVATRNHDGGVEPMPLQHDLDGIGDGSRLGGSNSFRCAPGPSVADGDGVELQGVAAGLPHPLLHQLADGRRCMCPGTTSVQEFTMATRGFPCRHG